MTCGSLDELLALTAEAEPDVVLTDIRMPPTGTDEGIRAAAAIRESAPQVGVVVLSQFASPAYALSLLEAGSEGRAYLLKDRVSDVDDLLARDQDRRPGGSVIDPKVVEELVAARRRGREVAARLPHPAGAGDAGEMATGKSNAAIAAALVLSERAVEKHINSIFSKLNLDRGARRQPPGEGRAAVPGAPKGG